MAPINTTLLHRFLATHPDAIGERLHLADLLAHNGCAADTATHYRRARDQLHALLAQEPADPRLYEQLARAQVALGEAEGAAVTLGMAASLCRRVR